MTFNPTMATEEEAKTRWCPLARANSSRDEAQGVSINRNGNKADIDCFCIASACMAWRKVDQIGIGPNGEKRDRDMDGRTRWVDRGYCGAFGNPVVRP
jgi:hypothetical protein